MMLLYHCLNIDKMAVRGTNAWGAMVQVRPAIVHTSLLKSVAVALMNTG